MRFRLYVAYTHDGMGRRVARTDSTGTSQYLYGNLNQPFQLTAMRDPAGLLSTFYYDDAGVMFSMDKNSSRYYIATDQVGTLKVVSDSTGTIVKAMTFDSFGFPQLDSNPSLTVPVGFAGGLTDENTGLVRFGYRDYDPYTGRWTAKDPIFFKGGQGNLYVYVQNNPINLTDPTGLFWFRQSWQTPGVVGRPGTHVPPGGAVSELIERNVPAGYTFGEMHDGVVDAATKAGIPDLLANIPSMIPMFGVALGTEVLRTLGILEQPKPTRQPTPCK